MCGLEKAAQGGQLPAVGQPGAGAGGQLGTQGLEEKANMSKVLTLQTKERGSIGNSWNGITPIVL